MNAIKEKNRLLVVDALRGFAIVSIMLLHNIEHFDIYYFPEMLPDWIKAIDKVIWDTMFFLFGGKSYAIFALLFGLTFFIQTDNQKKRGNNFILRFLWRMFLLLLFGVINSAFFQGDILTIYAVLGVFMVGFGRLNTRFSLIIAGILFLLPIEWYHLFQAIANPKMQVSDPLSWSYFNKMFEYIGEPSIINTFAGNLTNGKTAVLIWNWENGRFFTILALFILGNLAGRHQLFAKNEKTIRFWRRSLVCSAILFVILFGINYILDRTIENKAVLRPIDKIFAAWSKTSLMVVWVSGFTLLYYKTKFVKALNYFNAFGRMSLSNYVFQSIVGAFIYHGFGLCLYKYTGATYGLGIGLGLTILMGLYCKWWAKNFNRWPLEIVWHKLTWIGTGR